jgi:hypothetical protein
VNATARARIAPVAIVGVAVALALAGCGADDDDTTAATRGTSAPRSTTAATEAPSTTQRRGIPDACTLVTKDEAQAATGVTYPEPTASNDGTDSSCMYPSPPTGKLAQVEVYAGSGAKKYLDIDRDTLHHTFTPVAGIGDEAMTEPGTGFFRIGTTWVAIRLTTLDDPATTEPTIESLMRTSATRL